jgi:hypothetical protein
MCYNATYITRKGKVFQVLSKEKRFQIQENLYKPLNVIAFRSAMRTPAM